MSEAVSQMPIYAACDWGTSSFRLWSVSRTGEVMGERRSEEGLTRAAEIGFAAILENHLAALGVAADCPVVMCGMVGARQGWVEAPYVEAPAEISTLASRATDVSTAGRRIAILPGVCQSLDGDFDVMRGEETQLLGLALSREGDGERLVCLPGTHSKWARLEAGHITRFSTFMTGELYALLSSHSVLRHSLSAPRDFAAGRTDFEAGVEFSLENPVSISSRLFSLRAEHLLAGTDPERLAARLSGLLIGLEIAGARSMLSDIAAVTLVASGAMADLYRPALRAAGFSVTPADAESLARTGLHAAALQIFDP